MKKLSLIVALAVVLTIGGVFAAWSYPSDTPDFATGNVTVGIELGDSLGAKGSVTASVQGFKIEPTATDGTNYKAILSDDTKVVLQFTPTLGSKYNDGTQLKIAYTVTVDNNPTTDAAAGAAQKIFNTTDKISVQKTFDVATTEDPATITLTAADLGIALNDFTLDTKAKYDAFEEALTSVTKHFTITIVEVA